MVKNLIWFRSNTLKTFNFSCLLIPTLKTYYYICLNPQNLLLNLCKPTKLIATLICANPQRIGQKTSRISRQAKKPKKWPKHAKSSEMSKCPLKRQIWPRMTKKTQILTKMSLLGVIPAKSSKTSKKSLFSHEFSTFTWTLFQEVSKMTRLNH